MHQDEGMHLRPLDRSDVDAIAAIHFRACAIAYRFMDWSYPLDQVRAHLAECLDSWDWALGAFLSGRATGYIAMCGSHIDHLFVDPPEQGRGIGSALLAAALDRPLRPFSINVFAANTPARDFYIGRGFVPVRSWFNEADRAEEWRYELA